MMYPAASDLKLPGLLSLDHADVANTLLALALDSGAYLGVVACNILACCYRPACYLHRRSHPIEETKPICARNPLCLSPRDRAQFRRCAASSTDL